MEGTTGCTCPCNACAMDHNCAACAHTDGSVCDCAGCAHAETQPTDMGGGAPMPTPAPEPTAPAEPPMAA